MLKTGALAASIIGLFLLSAGARGPVQATTLNPYEYTVSLSNSAPGANATIVIDYWVEPPDSKESHHITFIPSAFGVATDADITNGARVGSITTSVVESISNSPCGQGLMFNMELYDATTDTNDTLPDTPRIPDPAWPGFADANSNLLPDAIDKYPTFLKNLFPGLTPRSRAYAGENVNGMMRVINVLIFDPGTPLPGMSPIDPSLGYIEVVVFQDPTAPAVPSTITDSCTPFQQIHIASGKTDDNFATPGNEANQVYRTNPASDGAFTFMEYARTIRDFDNDNIENTLDSCPTVSTPSWDPRINDYANDPDFDGLPGKDDPAQPGVQLLAGSGCDPTPWTDTNSGDHDADGFLNRQDNCPLVANPTQDDADADAIGDACDTVAGAPDGHLHEVCFTTVVSVGAGGTPTTPTCPEFVLDMDNDGYVRTTEEHVGTDPADPCGTTAWPADLVGGAFSQNQVDIVDLGSFVGPVRYINTNLGTNPGDNRWDVVPGSGPLSVDINLIDVSNVATVSPAMLGGARAFNGPPCPYSP